MYFQIHWENRISKSLNNMTNELGMVFSRKVRHTLLQKSFYIVC